MSNYGPLVEELHTPNHKDASPTPIHSAAKDPLLQSSQKNLFFPDDHQRELPSVKSQTSLPPDPPKLLVPLSNLKKAQNATNRFKKNVKDEGKKIGEICLDINNHILEPLSSFHESDINYIKLHEDILLDINDDNKIAPELYLDVEKSIKSLVMTADASEIVCLTSDGSLQFVDLVKQTIIEPKTFQKIADAICLTPDEEKMLVATEINLMVIDFKRKMPMRSIPHKLNTENLNKTNTKLHDTHKKSIEKSLLPQKLLEKIAVIAYDSKSSSALTVSNMSNSHRICVFDLKDSKDKENKNPQKSPFYYMSSKDPSDQIKSLAVFPNGAQIVSGTASGKINIWILNKKEEVSSLNFHDKCVNALFVSPDSSQIISGSDDMKIAVWKSKKNTINFDMTMTFNSESPIVSLALLPDGQNLITGTRRRVLGWNLRTGHRICAFDGAGTAVISADGNKICSGGKQNTLRIWEINDKSMSSISLKTQNSRGQISRVWVSAEKKLAICSGNDQTVKSWEVEEGFFLNAVENIGKNEKPNPFGIMSDGVRMVGLSKEGCHILEISSVRTGESLMNLKGHRYAVVDIVATKENVIFSISEEGKILRWEKQKIEEKKINEEKVLKEKDTNANTEKTLNTEPQNQNIILNPIIDKEKEKQESDNLDYKSSEVGMHKALVLSYFYDSSSKVFLVSGGKDGTIRVWDKNKQSQLEKKHSDLITSIVCSPDNKNMFSAGLDLKILVWETMKWNVQKEISTKDFGKIMALGLIEFNQGLRLVSGGEDKFLRIWDFDNAVVLKTIEGLHENTITCISTDKSTIMTGGADNVVKILKKAETKEDNKEDEFEEFPLDKYDEKIGTFSVLKGTSQMVVAKGKNLHCYDLQTGKNVQFFPFKHEYDITSLTVSEDNKFIITGEHAYQKPMIFVWDVETKKLLNELELKSLDSFPHKIEVFKNSLFFAINSQRSEKNRTIYASKIEKRALQIDVVLKSFENTNLNKINSFKLFGKPPNLKVAVAGEKIHEEKNVITARHGTIYILDDDDDKKDGGELFNCSKKMTTKEDIPIIVDILPDKKDNYLVCANENKSISIWDLQNESRVVRIVADSDVKSFSFIPLKPEYSENQRLLGFINGSLFDFESNKFLKINKWIKDKKSSLVFHLKDDQYITISKDFIIEKYNNVFCTKNLLDVLSSAHFLKNYFLSSSKQLNDEMNKGIFQGNEAFFPYYFNFMHLIALSGNRSSHTFKGNIQITSPFTIEDLSVLKPDLEVFMAKDAFKNTCFDILIKRNDKELFKEFINLLLRELGERDLSIYDKIKFFENRRKNSEADFLILVKAFEFYGSQIMEQLLNHSIIDYDNFAHGIMLPEMEKPVFMIRSNLHRIGTEELKTMLKSKISEKGGLLEKIIRKIKSYDKTIDENDHEVLARVRCKIICLENIVEINTQVISFMDKITELDPKNKIFCNKVLSILANYKWDAYAFDLNFRQFKLFSIFFIIYCLNFFILFPEHAVVESEGFTFDNACSCILDFLVFLYMIYYTYLEWQEFLSKKLSYIESGYNWIDVGLIIMAFTSLILDYLLIFGIYTELAVIKECIALSIFFFWLRVIIFLRGVNGTAFMITLIVQVVKDIRYFLLLIFLFLLCFDSAAFFLQSSYYSSNSFTFFGIFTVFYRLLLGDYGQYDEVSADDAGLLWFLMMAFTLLSVIILLNLLISIISDSFGKVFSAKTQARTYELLCLINAVDRSLNNDKREELRRQEKIGNYLFMFYNTVEENEVDVALETFNAIRKIEQNMINEGDVEKIVEGNLQNFYLKIKDLVENSKKVKEDQKNKKNKE